MLRLLVALLPTLLSAMRSRRDLVIENLALRQQLATLAGRRHPDIRPADRVFWVLLSRSWSRWAQALAIVRPDTAVGWHRAGFRTHWNWLSRRGKRSGRPPLPREVRSLIRRMATENPWSAPRIHGELLCLGFGVSERSVSLPEASAGGGRPPAVRRRRPFTRLGPRAGPRSWRPTPCSSRFARRFVHGSCFGDPQGRFIQVSPPPASAEGDRVPAGRWRRPFTRLATRSRPRSRRPAACSIPLQTPFCSRIVFWRTTGQQSSLTLAPA